MIVPSKNLENKNSINLEYKNCDALASYAEYARLTDPEVIDKLKTTFPGLGIYEISMPWRYDRQFFLMAKGVRGDLVLGWI